MPGPPDISVVIPTRERWPVLRRTLEAIAEQALHGLGVEVVVVDNGSRDGARQELEQAFDLHERLSLSIVDEPERGATAARNAGVLAARSELILFLGDDCPPAVPNLVAGHVEAHAREGDARLAVVGHISWDPAVERTVVMDWLERTGKMLDYPRAGREPPGPFLFYTGNVSLNRERLIEVGGFDPRFRGYGWQDHELALRLEDRGQRFAYRRELLVHHAHRYGLGDSLRRMEALGRAGYLLNQLHPQRRPAPAPRGLKAAAGRGLALLTSRLPLPPSLPPRVLDRYLQVAHFAALATGYAGAPLPDYPVPPARLEPATAAEPRPTVSVIVPFAGDRAEAEEVIAACEALELEPRDEVLIADNTDAQLLVAAARGSRVTAVAARGEHSPAFARNAAIEQAAGDWLMLVDSDCRPPPYLVARYLAEPIDRRCGAIAGAVIGDPDQRGTIPHYTRSRHYHRQDTNLRFRRGPYAATLNLLLRRAAWEDVGGFSEGIRCAEDSEFSWRLQAAGWTLQYRGQAVVAHRHRERLGALLVQNARYVAGAAWLDRRYPSSFPHNRAAPRLARCAAGIAVWTATAHFERALFKAIDALVILAESGGRLMSNAPPRAHEEGAPDGGLPVALFTDRFPELSETFVTEEARALEETGHRVRVEAGGRPKRPHYGAARGLKVTYLEDDGVATRVRDMAWLAARRPLGCARDMLDRRRWRLEEPVRPLRSLAPAARRLSQSADRHIHAHFAMGAALDAMRLARLAGLPYSITTDANDIFRDPGNLREKLEHVAFVTSSCDDTVEQLRRLVGPAHARRIHKVVIGVNVERFRPNAPHDGGREVLAVGCELGKDGLRHLVETATLLARNGPLDRLTIVSDRPLRDELRQQVEAHGLAETVELAGSCDPMAIRALLQRAALLAMPCVGATNGDHRSIPLVVKAALAMEVPVVASDEVGLREVIRPEWGRLVPPANPRALADSIAALLDLPAEQRAEMGRAGRAWVTEHCNVDVETARLARLIAAGARQRTSVR